MKNLLQKKLKKNKFVIVSHIFATGPALDLEDYLHDKVDTLFFIGHPFPYKTENNSFYRLHKNGKFQKTYKAFGWKLPEVLFYIKDAFYTFWWIFFNKDKFDYYIGSDNFDAFLGLILKKIGRVNSVILYTIDYVPKRFKNPILNFLYHFFDKQCLKNCKVVWNLSDKMAEGRKEHSGLKKEECVSQITVPVGIWYKRIQKLPFEKKNRYGLVFMGHLLEKQGLDIVIRALPKLIKILPNLNLLIIGTGAYERYLKDQVRRKKLDKYVNFTGYIEKHEEVEAMLAKSMVAVAMYKPDPESFTYFADPGKIKNYLSAGLPIILTNVPPIAKDIEEKKCALIAEYNESDFANKLLKLIEDKNTLKEYSRNAIKYAKKFDWDIVFKNALIKSIN